MTAPRTPARDTFDAVIDLLPARGLARQAVALVKLTYTIEGGRLRLAAPEPLKHDLRDPTLVPRLPVGTDFFWTKLATDFVVQGAAFASGGRPTASMEVSAKIGANEKRIRVFGKREISWDGAGKPRFFGADPFEQMELTFLNAYGGLDPQVLVDAPEDIGDLLRLRGDHPGLYPRNPFGKGYLVAAGSHEGAEMPNLEDPTDLLTEERLLVGDPRRWHAQPLPWCHHFVHAMMFPRFLFAPLHPDAWFPAPEDVSLAEVRRGFLMRGYRAMLAERGQTQVGHPRFFQEGSHGFVLAEPPYGETMIFEGMHPEERTICVALPEKPPALSFEIEGQRREARPRLHTIVARPAEKKITLVYGVEAPLTRPFLPGVHKHIPVSVTIDGAPPLAYEAPIPIKERLRQGREEER
ncbi:MAG: DUF2169 domain-containing protein [Minicystis sp.]